MIRLRLHPLPLPEFTHIRKTTNIRSLKNCGREGMADIHIITGTVMGRALEVAEAVATTLTWAQQWGQLI